MDSWVMFTRCMRTSLRNPDAIGAAIIVPAFLMWMFGAVFGNIIDVGDFNYVNFIVPGVIMQSLAQGSSAVAITVNNDMRKGIIDRFRSMPIAKSAVLVGHVFASVVRNSITTAIIIGVALLIGFRPEAGFIDWLIIAALLLLVINAITWLFVIAGLVAKSPEAAGTMLFPIFLLPFLSSGFAPTETMAPALRLFAEYQPMTPIIDALRALMLGLPLENSLLIAVLWSVGITVAAFILAVQLYSRKFK